MDRLTSGLKGLIELARVAAASLGDLGPPSPAATDQHGRLADHLDGVRTLRHRAGAEARDQGDLAVAGCAKDAAASPCFCLI